MATLEDPRLIVTTIVSTIEFLAPAVCEIEIVDRYGETLAWSLGDFSIDDAESFASWLADRLDLEIECQRLEEEMKLERPIMRQVPVGGDPLELYSVFDEEEWAGRWWLVNGGDELMASVPLPKKQFEEFSLWVATSLPIARLHREAS